MGHRPTGGEHQLVVARSRGRDIPTARTIVGGLGLSVLSLHTLTLEGIHGPVAMLDVEGFPIVRQWFIVHPRGKEHSVVAQEFLRFALKIEPRMRQRVEAMLPSYKKSADKEVRVTKKKVARRRRQ